MKEKKFTNKVAVITGGGRGIGKIIAQTLGLEGARVVIVDIDRKKTEATIDELRRKNIQVESLCIDLSRKGIPQKMIRSVVQRYGSIDILVNNARAGKHTTLFTETEESWEQGLSVTLKAAFFASQEGIVQMAKTGGGSIVNISSIEAHLVGHDSPVYHIAKAGILQMTRYLAVYAGKYNVRVNALNPGFIVQDEHRARFHRKDNARYRSIASFCHPLGRVGVSGDVAAAVTYLCSPQAAFVTGQCFAVDGGLSLHEQSGLVYDFDKNRNEL